MRRPLVTLTTDFGTASVYVAAMKGALLATASDVDIVDLTHEIPPQDVRAAALFLRDALPYFPPGVIHMAVVDPGVGSDRAALLIENAGSLILAPDNGIWTVAAPSPDRVWRLKQPRRLLRSVSATFHGRDVFAPLAGRLAGGATPDEVGEPITNWCRVELPRPTVKGAVLFGEVIHVDRFGNLITNLVIAPEPYHLRLGDRRIEVVRTYSDRPAGSLVALVGSNEFIEIAVVNGSAANLLGTAVGASVELRPGLVS